MSVQAKCDRDCCVVLCVQLRINLAEGRVAQIMGRGPYRVWFKGIDYPGKQWSGLKGTSRLGRQPLVKRAGLALASHQATEATPRQAILIAPLQQS
jgi:hypothetical protein